MTESKASAGFVNTFKPVKVDLAYQNQTVPISVEYVKGTNQEITGQTTLTKEDKDTGADTQGNATFKGAQYTLFCSTIIIAHSLLLIGMSVIFTWKDIYNRELLRVQIMGMMMWF